MPPLDEDLRRLPVADAALIQLGRRGWSAGEAGLMSADGRLVRLVVASKESRTVRAEGESAEESWAAAILLLGLPRGPPRRLAIATESEDLLPEECSDSPEALFLGRRRVERGAQPRPESSPVWY